ncbi:MAG TPA: hypothetical protein VMV77_09325 [Bacteroidales bacterium]|nr:hypothetical protein [Bacteroidales bacterium]
MFSAIVAGVVALAGVVISSAVQSSSADKALKQQDSAWREQMDIEEKQRKKDNQFRAMQAMENTINRSTKYKQQVASLWSGRSA